MNASTKTKSASTIAPEMPATNLHFVCSGLVLGGIGFNGLTCKGGGVLLLLVWSEGMIDAVDGLLVVLQVTVSQQHISVVSSAVLVVTCSNG